MNEKFVDDMKYYVDLEHQTSMLFWYPKIESIINTPQTEFLTFEGGDRPTKKFVDRADRIINKKFGYPVFIRTDMASYKHDFAKACKPTDKKSLELAICDTISYNEAAGGFGLPYKALVIREFLSLEHTFLAFNQLPISRERRCFVTNKQGEVTVECVHPYWPGDAIEQSYRHHRPPLPADWEKQLARINEDSEHDLGSIRRMAWQFGKLMPDDTAWSVDVAKDTRKGWLLIDAARAELSYHWDTCPNVDKFKRIV